MRIVNDTDHDGRTVSAIVRWVFKELDLKGDYLVRVNHHNGSWYGNGWAWGGRREILCRIGKPGTYPVKTHVYERKSDMPEPWLCEDWQEALVSITAHEAMHLRQAAQRRAGRRKRRQRGKEQECEWAAFRLWKRWREKEGRQSAAEIMQSNEQNSNTLSSTMMMNQPSSPALSGSISSSHQEQIAMS